LKAILLGPAHPLRGGIANFNESLGIAFIKNSIETEIISFSFQYPTFLFPGKTQKSDSKAPENLTIHSLLSSVNPITWWRTANYIKKQSPDIIIVQFWLPLMGMALGSVIRLLGKKNRPRIVAVVHNAKPHEKRFGDEFLTKYFLNVCDGFVTLSKSVLDDLTEFTDNTNKIFVPHPIYDIFGDKVEKDEARDFLELDKQARIILFFGIIRKYKGLGLLLKALAIDRVRKLNLKVLVAGEFYEDKNQYYQQISEYGLKDSVIISNKFISNDEVKQYFCAADLIVQPYLSGTQSGVTQIAYNFERPMLVTNVGGLAEIVFDGKTGYVTELDEESIANALVDFYENNREAEMSKNVAEEQYRFTWHAMVDAITGLTEKIQ
jgi:D-inositol-3-phosphate glycosyltransferase